MKAPNIWNDEWALQVIARNPALVYVDREADTAEEADFSADRREADPFDNSKHRNAPRRRPATLPTLPTIPEASADAELRTERLLNSCCLIDLGLPGNHVSATSYDLVPATPPTGNSFLTINEDVREPSWQICTPGSPREGPPFLLMKKTVQPMRGAGASHMLCAQLSLLGDFEAKEASTDVWFDLAIEEMHLLAVARPRLSKHIAAAAASRNSSALTSLGPRISAAAAAVQASYDRFFILGRSASAVSGYELTYRCGSAGSATDDPALDSYLALVDRALCHGVYAIGRRLLQEQNFFFDTRPTLEEGRRLAWCVRLFGRDDARWVCFLID